MQVTKGQEEYSWQARMSGCQEKPRDASERTALECEDSREKKA